MGIFTEKPPDPPLDRALLEYLRHHNPHAAALLAENPHWVILCETGHMNWEDVRAMKPGSIVRVDDLNEVIMDGVHRSDIRSEHGHFPENRYCALCDGRDPRFPSSDLTADKWNWTCQYHTMILIDRLRTQGRVGMDLVEWITNTRQAGRLHPDASGQSEVQTTPEPPITAEQQRAPSGREYHCATKRAGEDERTPGTS